MRLWRYNVRIIALLIVPFKFVLGPGDGFQELQSCIHRDRGVEWSHNLEALVVTPYFDSCEQATIAAGESDDNVRKSTGALVSVISTYKAAAKHAKKLKSTGSAAKAKAKGKAKAKANDAQ